MTTFRLRRLVACLAYAGLALITVIAVPAVCFAEAAAASILKTAFTVNFVKFTVWPDLRKGQPIQVCVSAEATLAEAMAEAFSGQSVDGHPIHVARTIPPAGLGGCQLLYVSERDPRRFAAIMDEAAGLPLLTVSDIEGSARRGSIIELFMEHGRLRFAINIDALERSRLKISSRLLSLAKTVRNSELS